jgi:methylmalonyl-CoA/ethylmalonyl-CoA epimerase
VANTWKFDHMVMIVKNIEEAFSKYRSEGLDVFLAPVSGTMKDCTFHGKRPATVIRYKIAYLQKGPFLLKLVQPLEGESPYKEFLDSQGEGIGHLHFVVADLEKEKKEMAENGIEMIFDVDHATHKEAHFDTRKFINMVTELRQGF